MHSTWESIPYTKLAKKKIINLKILETNKLHKSCKTRCGKTRNGARDST
jgi:hypothetical protein